MPYFRSTAKKDFDSRVSGLLRTAKYAETKGTLIRANVRDLVFHGAIFQLSATLEDYISGSLSSWLFQVTSQKLPCNRMPDKARSFFLSSSHAAIYRRFHYDNNEMKFLKSIDIRKAEFQLISDTSPFPAHLKAAQLLHNRKYPSVDNIEVLFARVGMETIFHELSRRTKSDAALTLKSFNDVRNAIAHASPPPLTFLDVERHFDDIRRIVGALDRVLYHVIQKWSGSTCWV